MRQEVRAEVEEVQEHLVSVPVTARERVYHKHDIVITDPLCSGSPVTDILMSVTGDIHT